MHWLSRLGKIFRLKIINWRITLSLILENLNVKFPNYDFTYNLEIPDKQKVAIIGTSGSGKTTMLEAIAGFIPVNSGKILFNGADITNLLPQQRNFSYVFQSDNHLPNLSIFDNVKLALINALNPETGKKYSFEQMQTLVLDMLEAVGIKEIASKIPAECSGGQLQRAAIARGLLFPAKVLLLDEPFSALDQDNRRSIAKLLQSQDKSMLIVTHNLEDVIGFVHRIIKIEAGKIISDELTDLALSTE